MANTIFQIKRSEVTQTPSSLNYGELAYSFLSKKLFIGNSANNAITIGGQRYTDIIDAATAQATANTLVLRDSNGDFSANTINANTVNAAFFSGNAATASKWLNPITLSTSGAASGSVVMDGSANVDIVLTLANVATLNANTYGSSLQVPVITVNEKGLVTQVQTAAISTSFGIAGNEGEDVFNNGETLYVIGGDGVDTTVSNSTITVVVDDTVIRNAPNYITANATSQSISGGINLSGDLNVTGNVTVSGTTTYIDVQTLSVSDSLIQLANNNVSDVVSIGFVGKYNDGSNKSTGLFRASGDKEYYLFQGVTDSIDGVSSISTSANNFALATLNANISGGTVSGLSSVIAVADGGTGANTFTQGQHITFDGTKLVSMANTGAAGVHGAANTISQFTVDAYGQVTNVSQLAISLDTSQLTSGTLSTDRGGIGLATNQLTANSVMFYSGSGTSMSLATAALDGQVLKYSANGGIAWGFIDAGSF